MKNIITVLILTISSLTVSAQNEINKIDTIPTENLRKNIISADIFYSTLFNMWGGFGAALNYERYLINRKSVIVSAQGQYDSKRLYDYLSNLLFVQTKLEFRYYLRKQKNKHLEHLKGFHIGPALIASGYFHREIYKPENDTKYGIESSSIYPKDTDTYHFYIGLSTGHQFLIKDKIMINLHVCPAYGWRQECKLEPLFDGSRKETLVEKKYWTNNFALVPFINVGWAF